MEPEQNPNEVENYPLDEAMISLLADLAKVQKDLEAQAEKQTIALNAQRTGALVLFIRQHKLTGNWKVAENGREMVKEPEPAPAPKE